MNRSQSQTYVVIDLNGSANIERQTEKAILVYTLGWLPKSQVRWVETANGIALVLPKWLWRKTGASYWTPSGQRIAIEVGEGDVIGRADVSADVYATA